ncbi:methylamine utilization protein [Aurantivibrio infirmus]
MYLTNRIWGVLSRLLLLSTCFLAFTTSAEVIEVAQKDKKFTKTTIEIKKGDTVRFVNSDPFFHNVFSLSDIKLFDLGSFPQGEHRDVVFDTVGKAQVECALHPSMILDITVTE